MIATKIPYGGVIAGAEEIEAVAEVLRGQLWACGPKVAEFEAAAAEIQGRTHALFVNSGSSALLLAMSALPDHSRIAMPALQFPTAAAAAKWCGHEVVILDIDDSLNLDPAQLEEAGVNAVLFVHLAGNPTNIDAVLDICERRGLVLIEDACEAFGGYFGNTRVGNFGSISCTSTHAAHQIATGEGGLVFTDDPAVHMGMKRMRDWGRAYGEAEIPGYYENYTFSRMGLNLRNSDIAAAIGLVQLKRLGEFAGKRALNYATLRRRLEGLPIRLPRVKSGAHASWYTFPLLTDRRDALRAHLESRGIETRTLLTGNITRQPMWDSPQSLPVADDAMDRGLWVSVHPRLTAPDIEHIASSVAAFFA